MMLKYCDESRMNPALGPPTPHHVSPEGPTDILPSDSKRFFDRRPLLAYY